MLPFNCGPKCSIDSIRMIFRGCGRLRIELGSLESQIEANWLNVNYFKLNKFNFEAIVITVFHLHAWSSKRVDFKAGAPVPWGIHT